MDYTEARNYIEEKNGLGMKPGLTQIQELLHRLGNPQNICKTLHIAGTNGKGSVFAFVQETLLTAGYHVGRYISPAVLGYRERFQLDRAWMPRETFAKLISKIAPVVETMEADGFASPTAFEIETAAAFSFFADNHVDYVLLECGMGGRLDATNVLLHPELCVFAQISMDHMQFLGDTLAKIASEKAGIIKPHTKVISAPQVPEVSKVLREVSEAQHCFYTEADLSDWEIVQMDLDGTQMLDKRLESGDAKKENSVYRVPLLGEHQIANAVTAITVLRELGIRESQIREGIAHTRWPGRMTQTAKHPYIYVDGAHNEAAWLYLRRSVEKYFTNRKVIYIIGVLKDKEYEKMVDILAPTMSYAVTVTPDTPRGLNREVLAHLLQEHGVKTEMADNRDMALTLAGKHAGTEDVILVSGSLSFLADYLR